jgi:hypothetical protein
MKVTARRVIIMFIMVVAIVCVTTMTTFAAATEDFADIRLEKEINTVLKQWESLNNRVVKLLRWIETYEQKQMWVYPDEVISEFAEELGYRPSYKVEKWSKNYWSLSVEFSHLEVVWGVEHYDEEFDCWRMKRADFEELLEKMKNSYLVRGVEVEDDGTCYTQYCTKYEIEDLFREYYGYDVDVAVQPHYGEDGFTADFILTDKYNGSEYSLKAVLTTEGWRVHYLEWYWFTTGMRLISEVEYATENVAYIELSEIKEELIERFGYCPEIDIYRYPWNTVSIDMVFEHLDCETYSLDYVWEDNGTYFVTEKVFENFLENL